jgi:ABC-type glycerol-3-phosphate transport system substrate-binding protein
MTMIRIAFAALAALLLAACASGGPSRQDAATTQTALDRAVARWQALIEGRPEVSWELHTPGARSARDKETYVRDWTQKPVQYRTVAPVDEICDADACTVTVELEYDVRIPLAGVGTQRVSAVLEERWVRLDGVWYYFPDDFR